MNTSTTTRHWVARAVVGLILGCGGVGFAADQQAAAPNEGGKAMTLQVSSTAFQPGAYIPKKHTGEGEDVSPALKWTDVPQGTKSLAVICDDPDAPVGTWVHWVAWGIPATARDLPEAVPPQKQLDNGIKQGTNDFRKIGYGGPMPPRGSDHRYFFKVYALDSGLDLSPGAAKKDLVNAMKGHVLAEGELMGRYKR